MADSLTETLPAALEPSAVMAFLRDSVDALRDAVLSPGTGLQVIAVAIAFGLAWLLGRMLRPALLSLVERLTPEGRGERIRRQVHDLTMPVVWLLLQWSFLATAVRNEQPSEVLRITSTLLAAWVVIHLASSIFRDPSWYRGIATMAWIVAALRLLHLLEPTLEFLDELAITLGGVRLSAFLVLKGGLLAAVLLRSALAVSAVLQRRIDSLPNLTPSARVLTGKVLQLVLVTLAVVVALGSIGIDLTAFAIFSGAVGVGVGFGLQKVVSNLISGIILLVDRSVKPGDVIEVGQTYGWVNSLGARYASIITRDGTEHLIPNEDLITLPVVNWSFSNSLVRRKVPIGIHYNSDLDLATKLILEAARATDRVLVQPAPVCLLKGFGDSSVDLELRFWISDPQNGVSNVADGVLRKVWHAFHEHGVEIPYPQRDIHLRSAPGWPGTPAASSAEARQPRAGDENDDD
jgi:small-conductance mechanosensitive channel